ncbi:hypothetical protein, partial [Corallococcus sp. 4LFB]|uniref:hypothetical protein n=1 Tax=Corallococcus sp. 4LFB TaxID=3383249 RepID=UPI003975B2DB
MDTAAYQAFTMELTRRVDADGRFRGLVALGSMAARDYPPDDFSDHDFFVIAWPGHAETLRHERGWLPRAEDVALVFRETAHGLKVVYRDGHLLEFAVFDLEELSFARVNRYRVLLDKGGVTERMDARARDTAVELQRTAPDDAWLFGQWLTQVLVGMGRHARGEGSADARGWTRRCACSACCSRATCPRPRRRCWTGWIRCGAWSACHPRNGGELAPRPGRRFAGPGAHAPAAGGARAVPRARLSAATG